MTAQECKRLLSKVGFAHGVNPKLISERLLCEEDKNAMLNGEVDESCLMVAVALWKKAGMPDYANGHTMPLKRDYDDGMHRVRLSDLNR